MEDEIGVVGYYHYTQAMKQWMVRVLSLSCRCHCLGILLTEIGCCKQGREKKIKETFTVEFTWLLNFKDDNAKKQKNFNPTTTQKFNWFF